MKNNKIIKECVYFTKGMHCASCEILIERRLLEKKNIKSVEATTAKNEVRIEFIDKKPSVETLNRIFKKYKYKFFLKPVEQKVNKHSFNQGVVTVLISLLIIVGFLALNSSGLSALVSVNSKSSLPAFFLFGLLAGFSSCSALVGGIILSMSKQWLSTFSKSNSNSEKFKPHILFNVGRLISYAFFGALLGLLGGILQFSLTLTSIFTIIVSFVMILLALQMLGVKALQKFQVRAPKSLTKLISNEKKFNVRYMPLIMGVLTFFLPCGFTITAQGLALTSGSVIQASLILLVFAFGTLPALLLIGYSTIKYSHKTHYSNQFLRVAGILVLFFALFNINSQMNVLGFSSLSDLSSKSDEVINLDNGLPPIVNGKQIIKSKATARSYEPKNIKVRVGIPVRWEITDEGTSGCTNAIISKNLFDGEISLSPGETSIKEFTPEKVGKYKYSCWMGMVSGVIEVVDEEGSLSNVGNEVIDSGAQGCGGSGDGGGCNGSCGGSCGSSTCSFK